MQGGRRIERGHEETKMTFGDLGVSRHGYELYISQILGASLACWEGLTFRGCVGGVL